MALGRIVARLSRHMNSLPSNEYSPSCGNRALSALPRRNLLASSVPSSKPGLRRQLRQPARRQLASALTFDTVERDSATNHNSDPQVAVAPHHAAHQSAAAHPGSSPRSTCTLAPLVNRNPPQLRPDGRPAVTPRLHQRKTPRRDTPSNALAKCSSIPPSGQS